MKTPAASHGGCAATTTIPAELAVEILALPSHPVGEFTAPGNPDLIVVYCPATPDELTSTPWRCDLPGGHPDRHVVHAHTTPDEVDYWVMWLGNEPGGRSCGLTCAARATQALTANSVCSRRATPGYTTVVNDAGLGRSGRHPRNGASGKRVGRAVPIDDPWVSATGSSGRSHYPA